jgi:hypothetical protein
MGVSAAVVAKTEGVYVRTGCIALDIKPDLVYYAILFSYYVSASFGRSDPSLPISWIVEV